MLPSMVPGDPKCVLVALLLRGWGADLAPSPRDTGCHRCGSLLGFCVTDRQGLDCGEVCRELPPTYTFTQSL